MGKRLYVGNISYRSTEEELKELFAQHASVDSVSIILDHKTGRSRGFAFVELSDEQCATKAVEALNGQEHSGRVLRVNEAFERKRRGGGGSGRGRHRDSAPTPAPTPGPRATTS